MSKAYSFWFDFQKTSWTMPAQSMLRSESKVAPPLQSTETCRITARSGLNRSTVTFISIELDSRADHFVRSRKSSPKALRPSTSKKLASELCDVQLAETRNCRAHIDPYAADIVRPRKSSHRDQRSTSTGHTTKLESALETRAFFSASHSWRCFSAALLFV